MKKMSEDELYRSFRGAEKYIDSQFRKGVITAEQAKKLLADARKAYKNQNYNRALDELV